jgi:hypothetical protein
LLLAKGFHLDFGRFREKILNEKLKQSEQKKRIAFFASVADSCSQSALAMPFSIPTQTLMFQQAMVYSASGLGQSTTANRCRLVCGL